MLFKLLVTFARALLQAGAVGDADDGASARNDSLALQSLNHRVDRRPLDAEQSGQRLLCQRDAIAGSVLRVKQPARGALLDRVKSIAGDRLHHLGQ